MRPNHLQLIDAKIQREHLKTVARVDLNAREGFLRAPESAPTRNIRVNFQHVMCRFESEASSRYGYRDAIFADSHRRRQISDLCHHLHRIHISAFPPWADS